jgi:hypothetical protein
MCLGGEQAGYAARDGVALGAGAVEPTGEDVAVDGVTRIA